MEDRNNDSSALKFSRTVFLKVLPVFLVIVVFFIFNVLTPVWWDDFVMSCFIDTWNEPHSLLLTSFSDVIASTYNMYNNWHGRSVADFLNLLFMFFKNKNIFNFFNTIVYCIFLVLICYHVTGNLKKITSLFFMFANILFWLMVPLWGQNFLWLTGSFNYLWTSMMILLFLIPFRKKAEDTSYKPHIAFSLFWIIPGILAGWSIENSASGTFVLLLAYFFYKKHRNEPIALFEIFGSIGFIFGFYMLMNSRNNLFPGILRLLINAIIAGVSFVFLEALLIGAIVLLVIELKYHRKMQIKKVTYGFFLAAVASAVSLIIPGEDFGGRSEFITRVFLIITLLSLVYQIRQFILPRYFNATGIALFLAFLPSFYSGSMDISLSFLFAKARDSHIQQEKEKGNFSIKVKTPIPVYDSHNAMYNGWDIVNESADYSEYITQNSAKAAWYGINSLDGIPTLSRKQSIKKSMINFLNRRKQEELSINDLFLIIYEDW